MLKINFVVTIITFNLLLCHSSHASDFKSVDLTVGSAHRSFLVYAPKSSSSQARPLLIFFHGSNSNAKRQIDFTALGKTANEKNFILVFAQTENPTWNLSKDSNPDLDYVEELIKNVQKSENADSQKIIAMGHSNGSQFVYRLLEKNPKLFYGMAVFAGNSFSHKNLAPLSPGQIKRFVFVHGENDEVFSWDNSSDDKSTKKGARDILIKNWNCPSTPSKWGSLGEQFEGCSGGSSIASVVVPKLIHDNWPSTSSIKKPEGLTEDYNALVWDFLIK